MFDILIDSHDIIVFKKCVWDHVQSTHNNKVSTTNHFDKTVNKVI